MSDHFQQARQQFLDGVQHFEAGRLEQAETCFVASLELLPGRTSTLVNLGATRLKLGRPDAALPLLEQALAAEAGDVDAWVHRGVALRALSRPEEALASLDRALALRADHAVAIYHRGMTLAALRRPADAVAAFERLVAITPDSGEAWFRQGQALEELERYDAALASYDRALALDGGLAAAWAHRGNLLKSMGRHDDAAAAFRQAIAAGGDAALNNYFLAAVTGVAAPPSPPRPYVEQLFNDYADSFESHLVGTLNYRGHRVLVEHLRTAGPQRFRNALDLGCGTGLCGPLVKSFADRVDGVDLSQAMLEKARALGVYDSLQHADVAEHLEHTPQRYDLVLAADVFIYVGALEAVFRGARRALDASGLFGFSVELASDDVDFELRASLRYAHSRRYVLALAEQLGFQVVRVDEQPIREDQRWAIAGLYVCLRAPASD